MEDRATPRWLDLLWIVFLIGLALLPPLREWHKDIILLIIGVVHLLEPQFIQWTGKAGRYLAVLVKIMLASILINHTAAVAPLPSSYWPIFLLPAMTAAMYFGPLVPLLLSALPPTAYEANL